MLGHRHPGCRGDQRGRGADIERLRAIAAGAASVDHSRPGACGSASCDAAVRRRLRRFRPTVSPFRCRPLKSKPISASVQSPSMIASTAARYPPSTGLRPRRVCPSVSSIKGESSRVIARRRSSSLRHRSSVVVDRAAGNESVVGRAARWLLLFEPRFPTYNSPRGTASSQGGSRLVPRKVILDVDPGIDDALALTIALFDPASRSWPSRPSAAASRPSGPCATCRRSSRASIRPAGRGSARRRCRIGRCRPTIATSTAPTAGQQ